MPKVSVIIPCYNHAHYLPFALDSVLAQTFQDWEAIVVDDGSTDNTANVCAGHSDPRILYTYQENRGLSAARNSGINRTNGTYIAFLDADDTWEPEFLARSVERLQIDESIGFVYSRNYHIDPQGNRLPRLGGRPLTSHQFRIHVFKGGFFPAHAALIRMSALEAVGYFDTQLTSVEDWDLWLRLCTSYQVDAIDEPLVNYRIYPGSMSTDAYRMHQNRFVVLEKHFGPLDGEPMSWPPSKREVYACGYRSSAYGFLLQCDHDKAWELLAEAARIWPPILTEVETYYEFALGDQSKGFRGVEIGNKQLDGFPKILERLSQLLRELPDMEGNQKRHATAAAHLAFAMLADQAGDWRLARNHMRKAMRFNLFYMKDRRHIRRIAKLHAG
jgi:glycosyltransferase involved in cell wall biosynthesis